MLKFLHDFKIIRLPQLQLQPGWAAALAPSCGVRLQVLVWNSFSSASSLSFATSTADTSSWNKPPSSTIVIFWKCKMNLFDEALLRRMYIQCTYNIVHCWAFLSCWGFSPFCHFATTSEMILKSIIPGSWSYVCGKLKDIIWNSWNSWKSCNHVIMYHIRSVNLDDHDNHHHHVHCHHPHPHRVHHEQWNSWACGR